MSGKDAFEVEGSVIEVLPNRTVWVELPNRHRFLAHLPGKSKVQANHLFPGGKVVVEMSPYDLSKGRIC